MSNVNSKVKQDSRDDVCGSVDQLMLVDFSSARKLLNNSKLTELATNVIESPFDHFAPANFALCDLLS
jgi:hypothetical protein